MHSRFVHGCTGNQQVEARAGIPRASVPRISALGPSALMLHMQPRLSDSAAEVLFLLNNLDDPRRIIIVPRDRGYVQPADGKCRSGREESRVSAFFVKMNSFCARGSRARFKPGKISIGLRCDKRGIRKTCTAARIPYPVGNQR